MGTIRRWLDEQGLAQYAEVFEANDIDIDVLHTLTDQDLQALGVSLGNRKRVLEALKDTAPSVGRVPPATQAPENPPTKSEATGERRQLTVMFCDLVGSTALSEKLDPEELRSLLHNYRTVCGEVIAHYEGFVARYVGDGILTYFGWPKAHEEDAERALRAALEIIQAVKSASSSEILSVRIGIATGPVVVGEQAGVGEQSKLAIGSTPNLAARLQGLASADQIVIASSTRRLVRNAFDLTDLGEHGLKGISEPVHAWRVIAVGAAASRFEAAAHGVVIPLVGREQELGLLIDRWQQAQQGEGQVVLLSGEPGIGKSRILNTFREKLEAQNVATLRFQCSPYHINSAFYPSIDNFERVLKFGRDETPDSKLDKLETLIVTQLSRPLADVRFIASMLSIPYEARYGGLPMTPQKFKDETLRTLVDLSEASAKKQPTAMLFEDAHWADPTSLEVMDLLIDRVKKTPLLIVLTHRPEFQSRWSQQGHVSALNLSKLTRAQSGTIVGKLAHGKEFPIGLLDQILDKTDGVPLYVEELTKSILESGELKDAGNRYDYAGGARSVTIPATLRDSLMARLDRFAPVKEIAQIGATIGREFSYELVAAVAPHSKNELESALYQLTESGLAFRRGNLPDATYIFKHALVRDAAYDSLLKTKRHELHAQIADTLEQRFSSIVVLEPETLAQHLTSAGIHERAAPYWLRAGERALGTVALVEAVGHLAKALSAVNTLPNSTERERNELRIRLPLSTAYLSLLGWAAIEVAQTLEPARELAIRLNENDQLIPILYYIWFHHLMRCEYGKCRNIVGELDVLAQSPGDSSTSVIAGMTAALTFFFSGEIGQASQAADRVFKAYEPEGHRQLVHIYNHDPKCLTLVWAGYWLWAMGYPDKARQAAKEQLEISRRLEHPFNLFVALSVGTVGLTVCGETSLARQWLAEAKTIADEHAMKFMAEVIVPFWDGPALIVQGDHEAGYVTLTVGSNGWRTTGPLHLIPFANIMRARALTALERFDEAMDLLNETLQIIDETSHRSEEAEVHCAIGELQQRRTNADSGAAEVSFKKALEIARLQGTKGWELRAAKCLANLWQSQDKRKEAYELLAPVYNWFTEGFDTKDLIDAKALLEELA
jgi:class 3 adenylate cyclase/predicted ATPase